MRVLTAASNLSSNILIRMVFPRIPIFIIEKLFSILCNKRYPTIEKPVLKLFNKFIFFCNVFIYSVIFMISII